MGGANVDSDLEKQRHWQSALSLRLQMLVQIGRTLKAMLAHWSQASASLAHSVHE